MLRDGSQLIHIPIYRRLLVGVTLLEGSHALHDSFSVIRWRSAGIDFFTVSVLWSESVFAEVVVFLLIGPWLIRRVGPNGSMVLAAGAGVLRWTVAGSRRRPGCSPSSSPCTG